MYMSYDVPGMVSVIVPVYKTEAYLQRCIDSILNQKYRNLEIILVDDGSPDGSGAICDQYARQDSRVRVIHQVNQGVSVARNTGLDAATGQYIAFVDSDDWIDEKMFDEMVAKAEDYQVEFVCCGKYWVSEDYSQQQNPAPDLSGIVTAAEALRLMFEGYGNGGCNKLFKKEKTEGLRFRTDLKAAEDSLFFTELLFRCKQAYMIQTAYYFYYQRGTSACHTKGLSRQKLDEVKAGRILVDMVKPYPMIHGMALESLALYTIPLITVAYLAREDDICKDLIRTSAKLLLVYCTSKRVKLISRLKYLLLYVMVRMHLPRGIVERIYEIYG